MNDHAHGEQKTTAHHQARKHVVFVPPTPTTLEAYAHAVCKRIAPHHPGTPYNTELSHGFTEFIRAVAIAQSNALSRGEKP